MQTNFIHQQINKFQSFKKASEMVYTAQGFSVHGIAVSTGKLPNSVKVQKVIKIVRLEIPINAASFNWIDYYFLWMNEGAAVAKVSMLVIM